MKFRKIISVLLSCMMAVLPLSLLSGCGDSDKITLKVYNWGEYISTGEDGTLDVIEAFEEAYPNIKVEYTTYATNEELYAKLKSGSANYDVIIPSDYMIARMIEEDMLEPLNFDNIPNYSDIMDEYKNLSFDPNNEYSVPYTWGTVGIIYNTTMVDEAPTSWDALWDEQYSGQILMFDNSRDAFGIALKKLGYSQNSTTASEWEEAAAELKSQKSILQAYVMDEIFDKMESGEAAMAPYYAGDAIIMMEENPDLAFVIPEEGTNLFVDSMVIPKGCEHKTEAEQFINFMCSTEVGAANNEAIGYSTPLQSVYDQLDAEVKESEIAYPSAEVLSNCESFTSLPEDITTLLQDLWLEIKSS